MNIQSNAERFTAFMAKMAQITVYDLDGAHADNADEMQNRHHAVISYVADYFEADILAFNWISGAQIDVKQVKTLDDTFKDFISDEYRRERAILRKAENQKPSAYDEGRDRREAA